MGVVVELAARGLEVRELVMELGTLQVGVLLWGRQREPLEDGSRRVELVGREHEVEPDGQDAVGIGKRMVGVVEQRRRTANEVRSPVCG